jgi:hypothetical protein
MGQETGGGVHTCAGLSWPRGAVNSFIFGQGLLGFIGGIGYKAGGNARATGSKALDIIERLDVDFTHRLSGLLLHWRDNTF